MAQTIRWLHLSDLHQGATAQAQTLLWPDIRQRLYDDLAKIVSHSRIDLVIFTGDLTQKATEEQFNKLNEVLGELWEHLGSWGSTPVLLPVPGNHDLVRPESADDAVLVLSDWNRKGRTYDDVRRRFWNESGHRHEKIINASFANYQTWLARWREQHPSPAWVNINSDGRLPGDFSATVEIDGIRLMVAGLNSAFLQLSDGNYREKLEMSPEQLARVCPPNWELDHDCALLLSHHPPSWLHGLSRQKYVDNIIGQGRFAAHLYGHMHEPESELYSISGGERRLRIQSAALFSRSPWYKNARIVSERITGYSIGQLTIGDDDSGLMDLWPRRYILRGDGASEFDRDPAYYLNPVTEWLRTPVSFRRLPRRRRQAVAVRQPGQPPPIPPPRTPPSVPSADVIIERPELEQEVLSYLRGHYHNPVVISGAMRVGKATLLRSALQSWRIEREKEGATFHEVELDCGSFSLENRDIEPFLKQFAIELGRVAWVANPKFSYSTQLRHAWDDNQTLFRLHRFIDQGLLPALQDPLLVVLRNADLLGSQNCAFGEEALRMFRSWAEWATKDSGPWRRLRLVLLWSSMTPWQTSIHGSTFVNASTRVLVRDFTRPQVTQLVRRYKPELSDALIEKVTAALVSFLGGHPGMCKDVLRRLPSAEAASLNEAMMLTLCEGHLNAIYQSLQQNPTLFEAVRQVIEDPKSPVPRTITQHLREMGILQALPGDDGHGARYPIYKIFLR